MKDTLPSGTDNRTIIDDGTSQKLSKEEIENLRDSGISGKEIVSTIIENSSSFTTKTEYSQQKYIKKKERKYCKPITVHKTNLTQLHQVFMFREPNSISHLRMDVLSQILTYSNVNSEGLYMLYDSNSSGLPAASLLDRIGANTNGKLVYLHPGKNAQITAVQAMNFPAEQLDRMTVVNVFSFLKFYHHGDHGLPSTNNVAQKEKVIESEEPEIIELKKNDEASSLKRKMETPVDSSAPKKPKWTMHCETAVDLVRSEKVGGLVIITREHPANIVKSLLKFVGSSRPFVIYHLYREPLLETYTMLKQKFDVVNLKLFSNFLRSYQVLPDRTHPDITTNDCGGYLLTGYLVN